MPPFLRSTHTHHNTHKTKGKASNGHDARGELNDNATIHRTPDGAINECVLFLTMNDACLGQENVDHFAAWVERVSNGEIVVSWVDLVELYCTQQHRTDATE